MKSDLRCYKNVVIVGANGGIGSAVVKQLIRQESVESVFAFSRCSADKQLPFNHEKLTHAYLDLTSEQSIQQMSDLLKGIELDLVLICTGLLHDGALKPEKSLRQVQVQNLQQLFQVNAIAPLLIAQQLVPLLNRKGPALIGMISARVGSISDNKLGGWYGYRASKSALNMFIKTLSIELKRTLPQAMVVGLHPGTVDTRLSQPFQSNVPVGKLFSPSQSADYLLRVVAGVTPEQSGQVLAWDGIEIQP